MPKSEAEQLTGALETVNKSNLSHLLRPTRMGYPQDIRRGGIFWEDPRSPAEGG